mmetsp:Transcript_14182/g.39253  ORF Transcript_14182/g.39253 Transcript_14182/m.39253 type:complete len:560 (+) Transcript_14182:274-1953(+)
MTRLWEKSAALLPACLMLASWSAEAASSRNVDFLRKVVAPVDVPKAKQRTQVGKDEPQQQRIPKLSSEDLAKERKARKERREERKARARKVQEKYAESTAQEDKLYQNEQPANLEKMPDEHVKRELNWFSSGNSGGPISESYLVDPSQEYDKWAQAYRFLGGYIDCDHGWGEDGHSGSGENNDNGDACSRWMIWAAYYNPYYQGYEYAEYFGNNDDEEPVSNLDCHVEDNTDWVLLGVYRQEHYQYIEQISKHLWAIDEEEYVVALAGLAFMTDDECAVVGAGNDGEYLYYGVAPRENGITEVALYTDNQCLVEDSSGMTPDDFGLQNDVYLGSKDQENDDSFAEEWWYSAQESTLTDLNTVYKEFQYCTTCIDYPTYQDGYYIGDYGTDDDDLINQCWKFWSHDSYVCEDDCLSKASAQGTILAINYAGRQYGNTPSDFYSGYATSASAIAGSKFNDLESPLARLLANAFLTLSFLLFVATFLAFAVARRSRYRESRSSRSRRLLDDDHGSRRSSSRRRSKSRDKRGEGGDGLFRDRRSGSRTRSTRSSSRRASRNND